MHVCIPGKSFDPLPIKVILKLPATIVHIGIAFSYSVSPFSVCDLNRNRDSFLPISQLLEFFDSIDH